MSQELVIRLGYPAMSKLLVIQADDFGMCNAVLSDGDRSAECGCCSGMYRQESAAEAVPGRRPQ